jgi:hypothetical protein
MTTYNITANGIDMGDFSEPSEARAIHTYASMLGYADVTDAAETMEMTVEAFLADLVVTETDENI